jgi:hypothetical protein
VLEPAGLLNRLVYDSLEPPAAVSGSDASAAAAADAAGCFSSGRSSGVASASSSCRTTGSGSTTRSNSTIREDAAESLRRASSEAAAGGCGSAGAAQCAPAAWYVLQGPDDPTLVFESRFECGNLRRVVQVGAATQRSQLLRCCRSYVLAAVFAVQASYC